MTDNSEYIPVTLWLAERSYRIRARKEDEEAIRLAAKLADEKIMELRTAFAGRDDQDFVAMCLLMYATDQVTEPNNLDASSREKLLDVIKKVDRFLEDEEH